MKKLAPDSETKQCLLKAFAGESIARNKYTYYAKIAKNEGYEQISAIFLETADNERAHAKRYYGFLSEELEDPIIKEITYPTGISKNTVDNLRFAAHGEHDENTILYPAFGKIAEKEGYIEIADNFYEITEVEKVHEQRYLDLMNNIIEDRVFKRDEEAIWKCRNCGYHHKGKEAPALCPACKHPTSHFELFVKNY